VQNVGLLLRELPLPDQLELREAVCVVYHGARGMPGPELPVCLTISQITVWLLGVWVGS
jgi:hypothetical protein